MHKENGSEDARRHEARPIDLAHLARQTLGDAQLEREVLALFMDEAGQACAGLADSATDAEARRRLAHRLSGAARAIGAFAVADSAAALEAAPASAEAARHLLWQLEVLQDHIAELPAMRGHALG